MKQSLNECRGKKAISVALSLVGNYCHCQQWYMLNHPIYALYMHIWCSPPPSLSPSNRHVVDTTRHQPNFQFFCFLVSFYGTFSCFATHAPSFDRLYGPYISSAICLFSKSDIAVTFRNQNHVLIPINLCLCVQLPKIPSLGTAIKMIYVLPM